MLRAWIVGIILMNSCLWGHLQQKVIICGVCRDVEQAMPYTICNIETLGSRCADYIVVIYENNSRDRTKSILEAWAQRSPRVHLISEDVDPSRLPPTREERIARARNIVLSHIRGLDYGQYPFLIMADLDFTAPWPYDEIVHCLSQHKSWDVIAANGIKAVTVENGSVQSVYWDRYAFRSKEFPLGPEVVGSSWWKDLWRSWFPLNGSQWIPVYSAFGGLALYKTATIVQFSYAGRPTEELMRYYRMAIAQGIYGNQQVSLFYPVLRDRGWIPPCPQESFFEPNSPCCEHLTLHAAMAMHGHRKFFVNPRMRMHYNP